MSTDLNGGDFNSLSRVLGNCICVCVCSRPRRQCAIVCVNCLYLFLPLLSVFVRTCLPLASNKRRHTTSREMSRGRLRIFFLFYERRFRHNIIPFLWLKVFLLSVPLPAPRVSLSCSRSSCNAETKHRDRERERNTLPRYVFFCLFRCATRDNCRLDEWNRW